MSLTTSRAACICCSLVTRPDSHTVPLRTSRRRCSSSIGRCRAGSWRSARRAALSSSFAARAVSGAQAGSRQTAQVNKIRRMSPPPDWIPTRCGALDLSQSAAFATVRRASRTNRWVGPSPTNRVVAARHGPAHTGGEPDYRCRLPVVRKGRIFPSLPVFAPKRAPASGRVLAAVRPPRAVNGAGTAGHAAPRRPTPPPAP